MRDKYIMSLSSKEGIRDELRVGFNDNDTKLNNKMMKRKRNKPIKIYIKLL